MNIAIRIVDCGLLETSILCSASCEEAEMHDFRWSLESATGMLGWLQGMEWLRDYMGARKPSTLCPAKRCVGEAVDCV